MVHPAADDRHRRVIVVTRRSVALVYGRHSEGAGRQAKPHCADPADVGWQAGLFGRVQTPKQIFIIYESNYGLRTIYMDGRTLPPLGGPQPFWHGYSVGRWEGDTLVVASNNFHGVDPKQFKGVEPDSFHGVGWLDHRGSPYTEAMTLTERFRRVNYGQLEIDMTVDDPQAYTKPFTLRVTQRIVADGSEMIEFICHENQMFLKLTGRAPR